MRTPEEIKKWLEYCSEKAKRRTNCSECIYFNDPRGWCSTAITRDALAYIQQLETRMEAFLDEALTYIQKLKAQQPRWISVGERLPDAKIDGDTSDGYHTFNELYHHRAVLFSVIVKAFPEQAWKSRKHHDGTMYDGMFIVGIDTPQGQATYHYDIDPYWKMFECQELECAPEWDGHTPAEAIARIGALEPTKRGRWKRSEFLYSLPICSVCGHAGCIDWVACPNCGAMMDGGEADGS